MILGLVKYTTPDGYIKQAYVPDNVLPEQGIPFNPPDVSGLNIPPETQLRLHNELVSRNLICYQNVLDSGGGLTNLLKEMGLLHIRRELIEAYKLAK